MPRCQLQVPPPRSGLAGFRFPAEVILLAVRGYLRYGLSYWDVEELLAERGIMVDRITVYRRVCPHMKTLTLGRARSTVFTFDIKAFLLVRSAAPPKTFRSPLTDPVEEFPEEVADSVRETSSRRGLRCLGHATK